MNIKLSLAGEQSFSLVPSQQLLQTSSDSEEVKSLLKSNLVHGVKGHRYPVQEALTLPL